MVHDLKLSWIFFFRIRSHGIHHSSPKGAPPLGSEDFLEQDLLLMAEILHQLRLVVYPIVFRVSYIPGGAGFQPSTVVLPSKI